MHKVSDGQRRRVQICMGLLYPYKGFSNQSREWPSTTPSSPLDFGLRVFDNGASNLAVVAVASATIDVNSVNEAKLKENGFRSTRWTKLVCTVGPATYGEQLEVLAVGGMNVARVNMCYVIF
ncbi:hypothetical protein BHE74_00046663 [Ensete ventricosum]|nr:hypothetical protein GW17_00044946 [Ensete ventricosum]RWW47359.1 hypothetical protein BHE74_00046663 [Ensete ventricosum]RZS19167.1 hypothetical protein BHM03_00051519 [Ensete ventricosum]